MPNSKGKGAFGVGLATLGLTAGVGALLAARSKDRPARDDAPNSAGRRGYQGHDIVGRTVTIAKPRQELFDYWSDFSNLASFMENLVSVTRDGANGRATWKIRAPAGQTVDVVTEVVANRPGEMIGWKSVPESQIETEGSVTFEDAPGDRGTRVSLTIDYSPPGGELGKAIASLFLREPQIQARHDLKRFKMLMETGEVTTSARRKSETRAAKIQQNEKAETA